MPTRLLVLEDDDGLRTSLRLVMEDEGYDVTAAARAEDALTVASQQPFDLMLVDLMLGGMDGFSFIQRTRPNSDAPIVVISARDATADIIAALEAGADDYITKPFVVAEVKARLRALLRRPDLAHRPSTNEGSAAIVLDRDHEVVFDPVAAQLLRGGTDLHLTHTEFRMLESLVRNAGKVLSRSVLLDLVWAGCHFGDERVVDVHIRRLRKKVEVDPGAPRIVITVRGLGYRLDLP